MPAYRYIPAGFVLNNPAISDSADWRLQLPPVIGRYAPPYAKTVRALEHQKAMFRRGDTALVVVSYDAKNAPELRDERVEASVTVSPGDIPKSYQARKSASAPNGIFTVKAPWGPLIMSAEVAWIGRGGRRRRARRALPSVCEGKRRPAFEIGRAHV